MHRRLTRFAVAAISCIALSPTIASAQWWTSRSNSDSTDTCRPSGCAWLSFLYEFPFGALSLAHRARSAARPGSAALVGFDDDLVSWSGTPFSSLSDCAACKSNSRPFIVPPGIEKTLGAQSNAQTGGHENDDDHAAEIGEQENGPPMETPRGRGEGASNGVGAAGGQGTQGTQGENAGGEGAHAPGGGVAGAVAPAVVVTPEPAVVLLVATGLLALLPIARRSRRKDQ